MYGIVRSHPQPRRIGKDRAQQPYGPTGCAISSTNPRQAPLLRSLRSASGFAGCDIAHERLNVFPRDGGYCPATEQRLYVPLDTTAIDR
jgi:hypothetical protein